MRGHRRCGAGLVAKGKNFTLGQQIAVFELFETLTKIEDDDDVDWLGVAHWVRRGLRTVSTGLRKKQVMFSFLSWETVVVTSTLRGFS